MRLTKYKVSFLKDLVSSDGHPFRCVQETIFVAAKTPAEATKMAQEQFQHHRNIHDWRLYADSVDIVEDRKVSEGPVALLR